jgi:hypothetical protein
VIRLAKPGDDGLALPFFEAYFSNFIEGTEFAVDEAAAIIFENRIPKNRVPIFPTLRDKAGGMGPNPS